MQISPRNEQKDAPIEAQKAHPTPTLTVEINNSQGGLERRTNWVAFFILILLDSPDVIDSYTEGTYPSLLAIYRIPWAI